LVTNIQDSGSNPPGARSPIFFFHDTIIRK
jgi:hypothetical protein